LANAVAVLLLLGCSFRCFFCCVVLRRKEEKKRRQEEEIKSFVFSLLFGRLLLPQIFVVPLTVRSREEEEEEEGQEDKETNVTDQIWDGRSRRRGHRRFIDPWNVRYFLCL